MSDTASTKQPTQGQEQKQDAAEMCRCETTTSHLLKYLY